MTLSISKLESLLKKNGFVMKKKFTINNYIVYVEVFNINNAEIFMLYIPSKYEINSEDTTNSYKIKYIDIEDKNLFKNLNERINDVSMEEYKDINVAISPEKGDEDSLEKMLTNNYNHEVLLKNFGKNDIENLKNIYYQLSRLKLCVKNIKYKLCIVYKNYLCAIRRNNDIECFIIRDHGIQKEKNIYVTIDLENLFRKISCISEDVKLIKNEFYKILNENQLRHTKILSNIIEQKNSIVSQSNSVFKKKKELDNYIEKLEILLERLNNSENKTIQKIIKFNSTNSNTLTGDIQRSHEIHNYEKEIYDINNIKQEIVKDILLLRNKRENITLEIDKILFDNNVMISIINKNFDKLNEL